MTKPQADILDRIRRLMDSDPGGAGRVLAGCVRTLRDQNLEGIDRWVQITTRVSRLEEDQQVAVVEILERLAELGKEAP